MLNKIFSYLEHNWRGILLGSLFAIIFFYVFTNRTQIDKTTPENGAMNVDLNTNIVLTFNQGVKKQDLTIDSFPKEDFSLEQIDAKTINLSHQYSLYQATLYTIKIYHKNKLLETITFTTAKAESNPRELQIMDEEVKKNYPLADKLPLSTPNYRVVYQAPLTLEVELYEDNLSEQKITQELNYWMQSQGTSPSSHTIIFKLPQKPAPTTYR